MGNVIFTGKLDVYSIGKNKYLRNYGSKADLSALGGDEYFSFSMRVRNNGEAPYSWKEAYVIIDGGAPWHWVKGQIMASRQGNFYIAHRHMKQYMTPGTHTAVWYIDGQAVHRERFILTQLTQNINWEAIFPMPTRKEIESHQQGNSRRSPYISAFLDIPPETRYTEYRIDFKARHLPRGTYCCLGCWAMDHRGLGNRLKPVREKGEWASAYAGFQRLANGKMASIMSFWDVRCRDERGKEITISAKRLYPQTVIDGGRFGGEGTGARCLAPFDWKADHWYRMYLKCIASPEKTFVEQWVCDLETGENTLLCRYDIGIANAAFQGSMAIFLENFWPETAGEVRSMEVRDPRYLPVGGKQWQAVTKAHLSSLGGAPAYEGSYNFGVTGDRIWMITSGVGGDWFHNGKGKKETTVTIESNGAKRM